MADDQQSRFDGWDLTFPTLWFRLYWMALVHLPSDTMIQISLDPTVVIIPEFERDDHDPMIPYKGVLTF
jgi:hypothetical protein